MSDYGSRFHAGGDLWFEREDTGAVTIRSGTRGWRLSPNTWASAVAFVSKEGESAERFQAALDFHGGDNIEAAWGPADPC